MKEPRKAATPGSTQPRATDIASVTHSFIHAIKYSLSAHPAPGTKTDDVPAFAGHTSQGGDG